VQALYKKQSLAIGTNALTLLVAAIAAAAGLDIDDDAEEEEASSRRLPLPPPPPHSKRFILAVLSKRLCGVWCFVSRFVSATACTMMKQAKERRAVVKNHTSGRPRGSELHTPDIKTPRQNPSWWLNKSHITSSAIFFVCRRSCRAKV